MCTYRVLMHPRVIVAEELEDEESVTAGRKPILVVAVSVIVSALVVNRNNPTSFLLLARFKIKFG